MFLHNNSGNMEATTAPETSHSSRAFFLALAIYFKVIVFVLVNLLLVSAVTACLFKYLSDSAAQIAKWMAFYARSLYNRLIRGQST